MPTLQATSPSTEFLQFSRPSISEDEIAEVSACLRSGWITTGPRTKQFEAEFASFVGSKHAVALNSCTAALHLALDAIGIQRGDDVIVPTLTFAATAEVVRYMGARPVLADCDADTLNIDLEWVERYLKLHAIQAANGYINRATGAPIRAVLPVHYGGLPCEMDRLAALAERYRLTMVEDVAHALPSYIGNRHVGTFGTVGAFSFYANKNLTTGEGGMLVTDDEEIADRARMMSLHGISRDAWLRFTAQGNWYYEILAPGFKYNMTDIAAAIGLVQLRRAHELWEVRKRYAARYTAAFRQMPEIEPPVGAPPGVEHGWHLYVIRLNMDQLVIDRNQFIEELKLRGIGTSVHYMPLHMHPYYRETYGYLWADLPESVRQYERMITLPLYPRMTTDDVDRVISAVQDVIEKYRL